MAKTDAGPRSDHRLGPGLDAGQLHRLPGFPLRGLRAGATGFRHPLGRERGRCPRPALRDSPGIFGVQRKAPAEGHQVPCRGPELSPDTVIGVPACTAPAVCPIPVVEPLPFSLDLKYPGVNWPRGQEGLAPFRSARAQPAAKERAPCQCPALPR
jgi:hypothetical protein